MCCDRPNPSVNDIKVLFLHADILYVIKNYKTSKGFQSCRKNNVQNVSNSKIPTEYHECFIHQLKEKKNAGSKIFVLKNGETMFILGTFFVRSSFQPNPSKTVPYSLAALLTAVLLWDKEEWIRNCSIIGYLSTLLIRLICCDVTRLVATERVLNRYSLLGYIIVNCSSVLLFHWQCQLEIILPQCSKINKVDSCWVNTN